MSIDQHCMGIRLYKMDSKSRVSIPLSWRLEPGDTLFLQLAVKHGMPMLNVFGEELYQERVERIRDSDKTAVGKCELLSLMAMLCRELFLDCRGRLLIPNDLRKRLGLTEGTEVILVGRGTHFEIWNKENFDELQRIESTLLEDQDLGIF
jgi:DNA-binding transcriptional regulator/RsmH inhibitor MraZ